MTFRPLTNAASRVAALLAGDVDMIEDPPTADLPKLKREPRLALAEAVSSRVIYLALDQFAEPSPGIPDTNGKNPLKDRRVRQALSQAIDRKAIVDRTWRASPCRPAICCRRRPSAPQGHRARQIRCHRRPRRLLVRRQLPQQLFAHFGCCTQRPLRQRRQGGEAVGGDVRPDRSQDRSRDDGAPVFSRTATSTSPRLSRRLGRQSGRSPTLAGAGGDAQPRKGHGRHQPRPLFQPAVDAKLEEAMRTVDDGKREALLQEASGP